MEAGLAAMTTWVDYLPLATVTPPLTTSDKGKYNK
jgi:hypothetical protein